MRRTVRAHRRGWGGVGGMVLACTLAVAATVVPLRDDPAPEQAARPGPAVQATYAAAQDDAEKCHGPVQSLDPATGSTDGAALDRIRGYGKLKVGVDQNSYLWGFRNPATGDFDGFDIVIVRAIAKDIFGSDDKDRVQFMTVPTAKRFEAIKDHKVDMVVRTVTINCERAESKDTPTAFSIPYFTAGQQVLAPKSSSITGFDDSLKGKRLCTATGSTGDDLITQQGGAHGAQVIRVANQLDCLVLVQLGKADAVFTDNALGAGQAAQDPNMHLVGHTMTTEPYGVAMNPADTDLVRRVNKVLTAYCTDGRWQTWYAFWLEKELPGISPPKSPFE